MASSKSSWVALAVLLFVGLASNANGDDGSLSAGYYENRCPDVQLVVQSVITRAVADERRMGASILRLFFHDCFVNGCDGSILLDASFSSGGEKDAEPNKSLRGFEVIDEIKSELERRCRGIVSCADILALASRNAVGLLGGPCWDLPLGRQDSRIAAGRDAVEKGLPNPRDNLEALVAKFSERGLDARDLTALSGAHTVGMANCKSYENRVDGTDGYRIDRSFAETMHQTCDGDSGMAPLDTLTNMTFDNAYYKNLVEWRGLLTSDQALYGSGGLQDDLVEMYSRDGEAFARDFANAMVKMGNLRPPEEMQTEVRLNCRMINS